MEPEIKYEILEKVVKAMSSGHNPSTHYYDIPDLSRISTRELLNECYRRRAIEKFDYNVNIDRFTLEHEPEIKKYAIQDLNRGIWDTVVNRNKFYADAMNISETFDHYRQMKIFAGEIYVCKHPLKVKK